MATTKGFGPTLRELRDARQLSANGLARRLLSRGFEVTSAAITGWERGEFAPKRKDLVEAVELELDAPGRLLPLLGYDTGPTIEDRLVGLEERFNQLEAELLRERDRRRRPGGT